jgi:hypothetical protein
MEEAGSGHEDSRSQHTNVGMQVLSRSQVTPELSMSMRYVKVSYIHTHYSASPFVRSAAMLLPRHQR